jgi:hypothetical protein
VFVCPEIMVNLAPGKERNGSVSEVSKYESVLPVAAMKTVRWDRRSPKLSIILSVFDHAAPAVGNVLLRRTSRKRA